MAVSKYFYFTVFMVYLSFLKYSTVQNCDNLQILYFGACLYTRI